jgi:hypothetical protein
MYVLHIEMRNPMTGDVQSLTRQFDPTVVAATLLTQWNNLAPAVQGMITTLLASASSEPTKMT